jgi:hypothetical protein
MFEILPYVDGNRALETVLEREIESTHFIRKSSVMFDPRPARELHRPNSAMQYYALFFGCRLPVHA